MKLSFLLVLPLVSAAPVLADPIGQRIVAESRKQIGTRYTQDYFVLKYPGGDPPKYLGACSDVIVRALRPVGYDLQKLMHEDMKRNFSLYPRKWKLKRTDKNIDHRRVANQRVYFRRFAQVLGTSAHASTWSSWRPGDIVQWKLPGNLDHTGSCPTGATPRTPACHPQPGRLRGRRCAHSVADRGALPIP
jgi:uncharacterized protein YijF (DUF1287 family)